MERRTAPVDPRGGGGRPASVVLIAAALLVAVAIVKPWGLPARPVPVAAPQPNPTPTPTAPPITADTLVAPFCFEPSGWRVFAAERWSDRDVRSWRSAETLAGATGPRDPRIPVTPVASQWIMSLGYCAPVAGAERPPPGASVSVYRLGDEGDAQLLPLRRIQPPLRGSPLGAVFAPPASERPTAAGPASGWQDGTYIFRIGDPGMDPLARWLGVRIDVVPPPARLTDTNPGSGPP